MMKMDAPSLTLVVTIVGLMVSYALGKHGNSTSDDALDEDKNERIRREGETQGEIKTALKQLQDKLDDIGASIDDIKKENKNISTKVAIVEASTKSAHKRIDRLEQELREGTDNE